jgi:hypothetical protein
MAALLLFVAFVCFDPYYLSNDDVAMRLLVEGKIAPGLKPSGLCLFMNPLLGKLLAAAYRVLPGPTWYDLLLGAGAVAGSFALFRLWLDVGDALGVTGASVLGLHFLLPPLVHWQFTLVATVLAAAGAASLVHAAITAPSSPKPALPWMGACALYVAGGLVRLEAALMIGLLAAPLAVPLLVSRGRELRSGKPALQAVGGLALFLAAAGALAGIDWLAYAREPGWEDFHESNLLRARLAEYRGPRLVTSEVAARLRREVGWTENDLQMLRDRWTTDRTLYSADRLRRAVAVFEATRVGSPPADEPGLRAARIAWGYLSRTLPSLLVLAALVVRRPSWRVVSYLAGSTLFLMGAATALDLTLKPLPLRLFWGVLVLQAAFVALALARWGRPAGRPLAAVGMTAAFLAVAPGIVDLARDSAARLATTKAVRGDVAGLAREEPSLVVIQGAAFAYEAYWRPFRADALPFDVVGLGVSAQTPPVQGYLARTGRMDLPLALCQEPDLRLIAPKDKLDALTIFLREHHGLRTAFVPAFRGATFKAFRCRPA